MPFPRRPMKAFHAAVLAALVAFAPVVAADSAGSRPGKKPPPRPAAAAPAPGLAPPLPLLWKVSDEDNALYLLGSFHLLREGDYPLSADVDAAFAAASRVVFEVAPDALADPSTGARFLAAAGYGDGRRLSAVLPDGLRGKLARLLARQGGSIEQLEEFEPWFVNLTLVLGLAQSLGFDPQLGLDQHLIRAAAQAGKPTAGLETIDDQLAALEGPPLAEQISGLADYVENPQDMPGMLDELHQAWRQGDLDRLDALTRQEMLARTPQTYRLVNVERNRAWLPQLQAMLDGGSADVLVVVGALHLLGEEGVVEGLRAAGYAVERICSACGMAAANDGAAASGVETGAEAGIGVSEAADGR